MTGLVCVTGRFQPLHAQHLQLLLLALDRGERLVVAVTNPDPSGRREEPDSPHRHRADANPFTFYERLRFVRAALGEAEVAAERYDVVPFPLHEPALWAHYVPLDALQVVRVTSAWEGTKADRLRAAGYPVLALAPPDGARLAASDVRASFGVDGRWRRSVPASVAALVDAFLAERPLAARCAP